VPEFGKGLMRDFTRWVLPRDALLLSALDGISAIVHKRGGSAEFVYEYFAGDTNTDGQVMALNSSATYNFTDDFSARAGIPIYFD
jgi:Na+/pantothenate symporter